MRSTDRRVLQRRRKTSSTRSMVSAARGVPWRMSQCLSSADWTLKLGVLGARRPPKAPSNWGALVNGECGAGGAIMAKNGVAGVSEATPLMKRSTCLPCAKLIDYFVCLFLSQLHWSSQLNGKISLIDCIVTRSIDAVSENLKLWLIVRHWNPIPWLR